MMYAEELVTHQLDLWAAVTKRKSNAGRFATGKAEPYGIRKLRDLILELAVRGLLAPQNPNDEPAVTLLTKIETERLQLSKEGKLKSEKTLPFIKEGSQPFPLPEGWTWARINDTGQYLNGLSFKQSDWSSSGRPIVRIQNLSGRNDEFNRTERVVSDSLLVKKGDFLVSWSATLDVFVWERDEIGVLNQHIFKVVPFESLHKEYLFWLLKAAIREMEASDHAHGLVMTHINRGPFLSHVIALPPLEEQKRIAKRLDELMALCDRLQEETAHGSNTHHKLVESLLKALIDTSDYSQFSCAWQRIASNFDILFTTEESIDQLKEAILNLAVEGKLVEFPGCSKKTELKGVLSFGPRNGFSPRESSQETGKKVLKLGATSYGTLDLSQTKFFDEEIPLESHLWLKAGDVLVQRGNSHIFVGSNVLVEQDVKNVIYPDLMMKLRGNEEILPDYLSLWLSAMPARTHMWKGMTGTSGTMPKISKRVVESVPIVVPPISVQKAVISKSRHLLTMCDELRSRLGKAQSILLDLADTIVENALART